MEMSIVLFIVLVVLACFGVVALLALTAFAISLTRAIRKGQMSMIHTETNGRGKTEVKRGFKPLEQKPRKKNNTGKKGK